jgi:hypothetical protein
MQNFIAEKRNKMAGVPPGVKQQLSTLVSEKNHCVGHDVLIAVVMELFGLGYNAVVGNPVPGGITGQPCSWGIYIREPGPPSWAFKLISP